MLRESEEVTYKNNRSLAILNREAWTEIVAEEFYKVCDSRCAYVFIKGKLYKNYDCKHHIVLNGRCKSESCGNIFLGFIDNEPENFPCFLRVRTKDTSFNVNHEDVRRPVRSYKRKLIGKEAFLFGPNNYVKKHAAQSCRVRPYIPRASIVRKCAHEYTSDQLGLSKNDGLDMYSTIDKMRDEEKYKYFIHDLKKEKFYVFYSLLSQLHSYKNITTL